MFEYNVLEYIGYTLTFISFVFKGYYIKTMPVKNRAAYANVISCILLYVTVAGGIYAAFKPLSG